MEKRPFKQENSTIANKKGRMANFELLRLLSMLMVVSLHYLGKGQILPDFSETLTGNEFLACFLESFSIVAVNAFVLLSGYFLVKAEFRGKRIIDLIIQVLFYAILVPVLLILCGVLPMQGQNFYTILNDVLPIQMEHYWFLTAYVLLYLFTPILNTAIRGMKQKQLKWTIFILLFAFCVPKSLLPFSLTIDRKGYDFVWFICVYLIGAYIRFYGIPFYNSAKKSRNMYLLTVCIMSTYMIVAGLFYQATGNFENQILKMTQYNHIVNLLASISFFYIFYYMKIDGQGKIGRWICRISPYALGVYLLHEQLDVRYLWPKWLQAEHYSATPWFLLHYAGSIIGIFVLGIIVDAVRSLLFYGIGKLLRLQWAERRIETIDSFLNGNE